MNILKKTFTFFAVGATCLCMTAVTASNTYAAAKTGNGVYSLSTSENDSCAKADVTGDGKADKIETVVTEKNGSKKTALKVNGKQMKAWTIQKNNATVVLPSVSVVTHSKKVANLEIATED